VGLQGLSGGEQIISAGTINQNPDPPIYTQTESQILLPSGQLGDRRHKKKRLYKEPLWVLMVLKNPPSGG
jgi:hypothetical protein